MSWRAILAWACGSVMAASAAPADELAQGFAAPPDSARPWVYWFVMDGNLSREGITADFEALHRVGVRGVLFMEVDVGIPKGPVKFMSPPWRELFKHANAEAARLGLVMTMPASPGWTGSGGPWVKPEQSMQKLVWAETNLAGPTRFEAALPAPPVVAGFYRDVAVLAFPTPSAPRTIENIQEKAVYQRGHYSSEAGVKTLLPGPVEHPSLAVEQIIAAPQIIDLTSKLDAAGRLTWDAPPGNWTVLRFGHTSTGANTRPAPEPGVGLECDKFDRAALKAHFDNFLGAIMSDIGPLTGKSLVSLHIDSWEMGPQNWTARFGDEFRQRRGYDLLSYLPVMTGRVVDSLEVSERFLWDLRQTVLELIRENHATYLAELAHEHGMGLSIEPYDGTPCDDMTYGAAADVPMCEFWRDTFQTWFSCTEATSIAHTYGKRIVQAEAFTSGDGERWLAHPANLKALGDWAFCEGINRFVFHRYAHQPWLDRWPGMTMGPYGIHYDRTQTWFEQSKAWIDYLSRCQFLLQQGLTVADVAFLKPEASPQVFRPPASAARGNPPERLGYNFDALTVDALMARASVRDGRLVLPDGMSYRVLLLPDWPRMTPALLRKLESLVSAGLTIIGPRPMKSPSLAGYPECDAEIKQLADSLWGDCDGEHVTKQPHGQGRVVWNRAYASKDPNVAPYPEYAAAMDELRAIGLPADFESDGPFRYTHRQLAGTDIYFVSNREERWAEATCSFRVTGRAPEEWDPMTGETNQVGVYEEKGGTTRLTLSLPPAGSVFVLFRSGQDRPNGRAPLVSVSRDGQPILPVRGVRYEPPVAQFRAGADQRLELVTALPGLYEVQTSSGKGLSAIVTNVSKSFEIAGPWVVQFQPNRGAPPQAEFRTLTDWVNHPDPGIRYFSGMAGYKTAFVLPTTPAATTERVYLDLGKVCVMAEVGLNGTSLGVLWKAPFTVDVTDHLRTGKNDLEVRVTNLWPNRLIGDQSLPPEKRVAWTTWNPFGKDTPLLPSGLLGPVVIRQAAVRLLAE